MFPCCSIQGRPSSIRHAAWSGAAYEVPVVGGGVRPDNGPPAPRLPGMTADPFDSPAPDGGIFRPQMYEVPVVGGGGASSQATGATAKASAVSTYETPVTAGIWPGTVKLSASSAPERPGVTTMMNTYETPVSGTTYETPVSAATGSTYETPVSAAARSTYETPVAASAINGVDPPVVPRRLSRSSIKHESSASQGHHPAVCLER